MQKELHIIGLVFLHVENFKYLGTTVTNRTCIYEEIKIRLNSGNAGSHSVQSYLSSCLLSRNMKIKLYKPIILPLVLYACETSSLTLGCLRPGC
jgi:hypothetical protein